MFLTKRFSLPFADQMRKAIRSFKDGERTLFWFFTVAFAGSALLMLIQVNNMFLVSVPDRGGELVEGIVGSPRFVNPVLAISDADKDLSALVYAGLMKTHANGTLVPDIAESYTIGEDGKTYTFTIRENARFHDGTPVTALDVAFTVSKAQDPSIKSPKRANWEGVEIVRAEGREIEFRLKEPYGPFLENTTLGILPKHIWQTATADEFTFSEYNVVPVGSGPYRVTHVGRSSAGVPNTYNLRAWKQYSLGEPFITNIVVKFFPSEADLARALEAGDVESAGGLSPYIVELLEDGRKINSTILPRIFGIFFNQNQASIFSQKDVREALDAAIDKEAIVRDVLKGYGATIHGPVPPLTQETLGEVETDEERLIRIETARDILTQGGWEQNEEGIWQKKVNGETLSLSFALATGNAEELKNAANLVVQNWREIGVIATVSVYETGDLNQNIIRPRKYDALLFGEIIGRDLDLFPFWHSSQRNDPGLNIALYVNPQGDKILEEARITIDPIERREKYLAFEALILDDAPATFLYAPSYIYITPQKVENITLGQLTYPGERFSNVHEWFIEKNNVWKIFTD